MGEVAAWVKDKAWKSVRVVKGLALKKDRSLGEKMCCGKGCRSRVAMGWG